jgi:hypothetical protein
MARTLSVGYGKLCRLGWDSPQRVDTNGLLEEVYGAR